MGRNMGMRRGASGFRQVKPMAQGPLGPQAGPPVPMGRPAMSGRPMGGGPGIAPGLQPPMGGGVSLGSGATMDGPGPQVAPPGGISAPGGMMDGPGPQRGAPVSGTQGVAMPVKARPFGGVQPMGGGPRL